MTENHRKMIGVVAFSYFLEVPCCAWLPLKVIIFSSSKMLTRFLPFIGAAACGVAVSVYTFAPVIR